jgi:predicted porin
MKKFLIALSAITMLAGAASAQTTTTTDNKASVQSDTVKHVKKRHYQATTDGYSKKMPTRDAGRYSNLPGKDGLNSKAFLVDH